jgi:hypothetical protein
MKKLFLVSLVMVFVLAATSLYAAERLPLGNGTLAVKVDYINFTESAFKDLDLDQGLYLGLEAYAKVIPNLYIGLESGYVFDDGKVDGSILSPDLSGIRADTELIYVPIELNMKFVIEPAPNLALDLGVGGSYNYAKVKAKAQDVNVLDEQEWLWGGQFFGDLNYKIQQFVIGINGKYQLTEKFKDSDTKLNNWRVGGQIGVLF